MLICNILPWCVPSDTPLLQLLSFPDLLLCLMFDGLVTARPQLKVGYLDDVLHVLEKPILICRSVEEVLVDMPCRSAGSR